MVLWSTHAYTDKIDEITEVDTRFTSKVQTDFGASYEFLVPKTEALDSFSFRRWSPNANLSEVASEEPQTEEMVSYISPPGRRIWLLFPTPVISLTDDDGITTWMWRLSFD